MAEISSNYETLLVRRQKARLHITLNRPEAKNALSPTMIDELTSIFDALEDRRDIKAIVLRGAGGQFCAGADLKNLVEKEPLVAGHKDPLAVKNRKFGTLLEKIVSAPQVIVAAIEGFALAGGLGLACASDITVATEDAFFAITEVALGLVPAQMAPFVVLRIGISETRRLALTASRFNGAESLRLGLSHYLVKDANALDAQVEELLKRIDRGGPLALAATKAVLSEAAQKPLPDVLDFAAEKIAETLRGPEVAEGLEAFAAKRAPSWVAG